MTPDQKWQWRTWINPEGTRKFERIKKVKAKKAEVPPEPEIPSDFLSLHKVRPIQQRGSTQAAHIAEALEEKEN